MSDTLSPDPSLRRLSTASHTSTGSTSSGSSLGVPSHGIADSMELFDTSGGLTPLIAARSKNGKNSVMKAGYSKVKKTTTSMFKPKSRPSSMYMEPSPSQHQASPISLAELDTRLAMLESSVPERFLSVPDSPTRIKWNPHFTTPRVESGPPIWPEITPEIEPETHTQPEMLIADKTFTERVFLYLAAGMIAIPNMALSWRPMTIAVIIASAVAVVCGFRTAVAIPVIMLLNPASPLWRTDGARKREEGLTLVVSTPPRRHHQHTQHTQHKSPRRGSHQVKRPLGLNRRHSAC